MSTSQPVDCSLYGETALSLAYRILGFADREPDSPNYGCFERNYWHYRQIDFVNGRCQEAAHYLALIYRFQSPNNRFYQNPKIKEWAKAGVRFWASIQRGDGSFDEYWPFERSFVATAFSLAAVSETCLLLKLQPPEEAIRKAAEWLHRHENMMVLNQMAGAAVALQTSAKLLGDSSYAQWADKKVDTLLSHQSPEGYFDEYGGYDIGYLTINLSYLAKYYLLTGREDIKQATVKAFRFLEDKIFENGTYDYQKTSRKTQYFYPFGFRVFEEWDLLSRHHKGSQNNEVVNPTWMDDRYCIPLSIDYLQTAVYPELRWD